MKMKLKELVDAVNSELSTQEYKDQRISSALTERRIRDYITKGILDQGIREGRNTYYNKEHLKQLIEIRKLQSKGVSDKLLVNFSTSYQDQNENQESEQDLGDILSNIENRNVGTVHDTYILRSKSALYSSTSSMIKENFEVNSYEEYPIDKEKNIFLKIRIGTKINDIDSSIEKAKKILNNKKEN
jgi:DNA-binding transcriptional MerR regulator